MEILDTLKQALGLDLEPKHLDVLQVCLRGVVVFFFALIVVRVADRRFMSKMTAFDTILGFMLASALARAINGSAPFLPTLVMGLVLALLHRFLAWLAVKSDGIGIWVKGRSDPLITQGQPDLRAQLANHISEKDLLEAARQHGRVERLNQIQTAVLERSGKISVIPRRDP